MAYGFIKRNIKKIIFHLCNAILLLHKNHIAHKDIKLDNITLKYNTKGKKARINIIDFGLSATIYTREYTDYEYTDLLGGGTLVYKPPDIRMLSILIDKINKYYRKHTSNPLHKLKPIVLLDNNLRRFEKQIIQQYNSLNLKKNGINISGIKTESQTNASDVFYDDSERNKLYDMLISDIVNGKLEKEYFGPFGHFYKWDVYALGLVFVKFIKKFNITDKKCIDLVNHMITINYKERYTFEQCLKHHYFKGMAETDYVEIYENYPINKEQYRKGLHILDNNTVKKFNKDVNVLKYKLKSHTLKTIQSNNNKTIKSSVKKSK